VIFSTGLADIGGVAIQGEPKVFYEVISEGLPNATIEFKTCCV
jgi:hypothetical protein